jgi:hypothetical protein
VSAVNLNRLGVANWLADDFAANASLLLVHRLANGIANLFRLGLINRLADRIADLFGLGLIDRLADRVADLFGLGLIDRLADRIADLLGLRFPHWLANGVRARLEMRLVLGFANGVRAFAIASLGHVLYTVNHFVFADGVIDRLHAGKLLLLVHNSFTCTHHCVARVTTVRCRILAPAVLVTGDAEVRRRCRVECEGSQ